MYYPRRRIPDLLSDKLGIEVVQEAFECFTSRECVYHTWRLFQTFLNQVASGTGCWEQTERSIQLGIIPPTASPGSSAYCNARDRLPEEPLYRLSKETGEEVNGEAGKHDLFRGRKVMVVDGTSVQLPDALVIRATKFTCAGIEFRKWDFALYTTLLDQKNARGKN